MPVIGRWLCGGGNLWNPLPMKRAIALSILIAISAPQSVLAQASDPAAVAVQSIENGLIGIMRAGNNAGMAGRSRRPDLAASVRTRTAASGRGRVISASWSFGITACAKSAM